MHLRIPALLLASLLLDLAAVPARALEDPRPAAEAYLEAWSGGKHEVMYGLLSTGAQKSYPMERFVQRHAAIARGGTFLTLAGKVAGDFQPLQEHGGYLPIVIEITTACLGTIREETTLPLVLEQGRWRVDWNPSVIFRDLTDAHKVSFVARVPRRGRLLDRGGKVLAADGNLQQVGVVPSAVKKPKMILAAFEKELGIAPDRVGRILEGKKGDEMVIVRTLTAPQSARIRSRMETVPGIRFSDLPGRVYEHGTTGCHVIGSLGKASAEDLKILGPRGYGAGDRMGKAGVEAWAEKDLAGSRGGRLRIVDENGVTTRMIADLAGADGVDVRLTLDLDLQQLAEEVLGSQPGCVAMIEVGENRIRAMASYPRFDPGQFVAGFSDEEWRRLQEDSGHPFQNRALVSAYPPGSVFKPVTLAAGLERGVFTPDSPFECPGTWSGLGDGTILNDWTPEGHGKLTLARGMVGSCDIVFYETGKKLHGVGPGVLSGFARDFGLGAATGLAGAREIPGLVPDPAWKEKVHEDRWYLGDTVNLAIGQGFLNTTPLQILNMYAAIARGGEIRNPLLVEKVGDRTISSEARGKLPASPATMAVIRRGLEQVVSDPGGTAYKAFRGANYSAAAKTGSAETEVTPTHAWFAAYAPLEAPQVALVVLVESKGHGGDVAAPLARRLLDGWFERAGTR